MGLSGKDHEAYETAERIHHRHDLAGQAASRASDTLFAGPPLAPAAFRCACTMVPSAKTCSRSNSSGSSPATCSKMSNSAHRRKRLKMRLLAEMLRCVTPWRSGGPATAPPRETACPLPGGAGIGRPAGQHGLDPRPHGVGQHRPVFIHPSSASPARAVISTCFAAGTAPARLIRKSIVNRP